jgi:hypothetical protein
MVFALQYFIVNPKFTTSEGKLIEKKEDIEIKK